MTTLIKKAAAKTIRRMDKTDRERMMRAIDELSETPDHPEAEQVKGTKNVYRYRVGDRRLLFNRDGEDITILDVVTRGQAYDPRRLQQLDKD